MTVPSTIDEFLEVVLKSGVLEKDALDPYVQQMRGAGTTPERPAKMGAAMVRDGLLTPFQVGQFLQGKWRGFCISGKYKLLDHLGAGGMGNVFLCQHKSMRRRVAIKVLPAAQAKDKASLDRFYREARAVAALDHPNIVRAHDIDHDGKYHFLVLEHVDGSSLEEIVKKTGPMDVTRAAHYIRQAALGLHQAHLAGLVHRDVKPGNLLLDRQGVVKILDMGLARFFQDKDEAITKQHDEHAILGTADYLAPEQAMNSHEVDVRADVYSLGATFYFLLAGRPPFGSSGTVAQKLVSHQLRAPDSVRIHRPETPEGLAAVVARMMAKDPAERFQTPADVYEALAPWTQTPIPPPPEEEMPNSGVRLGGGAQSGSNLTPTTTSAPWLSSTAMPVFPSAEATAVGLASPTGRAAASIPAIDRVRKWTKRKPVLWTAAGVGGAMIAATVFWGLFRLTQPAGAQTPPPEGPGRIVAPDGGSPPVAKTPALGTAVDAGDGGRRVKTARYEARIDADGRLTSLRTNGVEFLEDAGAPRGSYFAAEGETRSPLRLAIVEQPAATAVVARGDKAAVRCDFGPEAVTLTTTNNTDGPLSYFVVLNRKATAMSDGAGDYRKVPVEQEEWGTAAWYAGRARLCVRGGTRLWGSADEHFQTWYAGLTPHETRTLSLEIGDISSEEADRVAALDGSVVAAPPAASPEDLSHICILSVDGWKEREFFASRDRRQCPIWTPDGKSILASSNGRLSRLPLVGRPPETFDTGAVRSQRDYAFSRDGRRLAFNADAIYLVPPGGGEPTPIFPKKQGYVHGLSPDAKTVVYCAGRENLPLSIYARPVDGGDEYRLTSNEGTNDAPDYSSDGKWIYFSSDRSGKMAIWRIAAAGAGPNDARAQRVTDDADVVLRVAPLPGDKPEADSVREVARLIGGQGTINAPCWAADGKSFAFVRYTPKK
jgi:serine/threonine protein kinase